VPAFDDGTPTTHRITIEMTIELSRRTLAGVPVLIAQPAARAAPPPAVLWYPGYRASAAANEAELARLAGAGFLAVGVDAVGHGVRATGDPDERIAGHPRGVLGVMLELAGATVAEIPALVAALLGTGLAALPHVAVVGVSMGGYIAYRAPLVAPEVRTVVALLGSPEWSDEPGSPHRRADAFRDVALLSITAERDVNVPPAAARRFHAALAATAGASARIRHLELAGAEHLMTGEQWERAIATTVSWLRQHHPGA
jgi:pimeloyl-ACP methyl ester carboxylesterase